MKTYKQFISETKQLDESKVKLAKIAFKGLKNIGKKLFKKAPKVPPRSIDPYFANLAVQRGTMVRGFHGQSAANIAKYKKIGIPPAKSGLKTDPLVQYKDNAIAYTMGRHTNDYMTSFYSITPSASL